MADRRLQVFHAVAATVLANSLLRSLPEPLWSNAPLDKAHRLEDANVSYGHSVVDLGEDEFQVLQHRAA